MFFTDLFVSDSRHVLKLLEIDVAPTKTGHLLCSLSQCPHSFRCEHRRQKFNPSSSTTSLSCLQKECQFMEMVTSLPDELLRYNRRNTHRKHRQANRQTKQNPQRQVLKASSDCHTRWKRHCSHRCLRSGSFQSLSTEHHRTHTQSLRHHYLVKCMVTQSRSETVSE